MEGKKKSPSTIWIIVGAIAIVIVLFAGLLPLPGQKDERSAHTQPSPTGTSPAVAVPTGPPTAPAPGEAPPAVQK